LPEGTKTERKSPPLGGQRRALRQAVLARMERDAELAAQTGQPMWADVQLARKIIVEEGFAGLFRALKQGVALPAVAFGPLVKLLVQQEEPVE
jgi:hypothetical protein